MRIYNSKNVMEAARERIEYLFDEFPNVVVGFSGGKDSTVALNLSIEVARAKGRLPVRVIFIDQEAEWATVIRYVRSVMDRPEVKPMWFQMPLRIFNSSSTIEPWLHCWADGEKWMREKEPDSIKVNRYGSDRFATLFEKIFEVEFRHVKSCYIAGVRAEESPTRFVATTSEPTYKHITWGKILNRKLGHYTFYPLYDWTHSDIWKAIHENGWPYCKLYDVMYQYGVPLQHMRVSNVHHETAVRSLFYLQEFERDTWNKLTQRISGINTAGHLKQDNFFVPKELPFMFSTWKEYRDYLLEHLISDDKAREKFRRKFAQMDKRYAAMHHIEDMHKVHIGSILANDYHFTKIQNWETRPTVNSWRKYQVGIFHPDNRNNKYITG